MGTFWRGLVVLALSGLTALICDISPSAELGDDSGVVMELPETILDYESVGMEPTQAELDLLPEDTKYERRQYHRFDGRNVITCSIVLAGADSRSIHRPEICLPSQGWSIVDRFKDTVDVEGTKLGTTVLLVERDVQLEDGTKTKLRSYNVYWFVGKDITTASHLERVLKTSLDNVFRNVNHRWAYVLVQSVIPISGDVSQEATLDEINRFISATVPKFQKSFLATGE